MHNTTPSTPETVGGCVPPLVEGSEDGGFTVYTEGDVLYGAMLESIAAARSSIRLETYILAGDEIGMRFAHALGSKVRQGVSVQVMMDAAGALLWGSQGLVYMMRKQGVDVRLFHRWDWRSPLRYNRRDHRKMLIVDNRVLYLGGFNIHRESSRDLYGETRWRDTHVKVSSDLAQRAAILFDIFWQRERYWYARREAVVSALVPNHNHVCRLALRSLFSDGFEVARRTVYVTTPYFVPDHRTQRALREVARRGIDVRLLLPGKSDVWLAQWASRAAYAELLKAGVRIYEYMPRMLHAKTAVVDGVWATLGTANIDYRSLFINYEVNLVSRDRRLCRGLQESFLQDLTESVEVLHTSWEKRPWNRHVSESIGWMARRWL